MEVAYKGTNYAGFQIQQNADTVQQRIETAVEVLFKQQIALTGSSRTDAGVHARQNFFHFDSDLYGLDNPRRLYNLNALLPVDIVVNHIFEVPENAHSRFDATARVYKYYIYSRKNPFLNGQAYFYPYTLDVNALQDAAMLLKEHSDFTSFSKKNTQVKNFMCEIYDCEWLEEKDTLVFHIRANRFLRGMVKALTGTMLRVGRGKISLARFRQIIEARDSSLADFSVASHGLFLEEVQYHRGLGRF